MKIIIEDTNPSRAEEIKKGLMALFSVVAGTEVVVQRPEEKKPDWWREKVYYNDEGTPYISGVKVQHIVKHVIDGWSWMEILTAYSDMDEDDIRAALTYAIEEDHGGYEKALRRNISHQEAKGEDPRPVRDVPKCKCPTPKFKYDRYYKRWVCQACLLEIEREEARCPKCGLSTRTYSEGDKCPFCDIPLTQRNQGLIDCVEAGIHIGQCVHVGGGFELCLHCNSEFDHDILDHFEIKDGEVKTK